MSARRLSFLGFVACFALAGDADSGELEDALRLAQEGRCAEALPLLPTAPAGAGLRARGLCALRAGDAASAVRDLEALLASDPSVAVDLAVARYHAGDRARAEEAFLRADVAGEPRAEVSLYLGLIELDRAEAASAARRFERARQLDPLQVEPAASYYGGVALARAGEPAAARTALTRVIEGWPGSVWALEAERLLAAARRESPWFASLRVGAEHDTNAVLRGAGVVLPAEIPGEDDQRLVWSGVAGATRAFGPATRTGASAAFSGSVHRQLSDFDALHPALALWLDRRLSERFALRGLASYSHAWVDEDDFLSAPGFALELHRDGRERGATRAFIELTSEDYRFPIEDDPSTAILEPDVRDRDGFGTRIGLDHRWDLPQLGTALRATAAFRRFAAEGPEYSFDSPELAAGFETTLPAELVLIGAASFAYRWFRHPTSFPDPDSGLLPPGDRREREWRTDLALQRTIRPQLGLEARWRYQRNHSTADVFDFSRHLIGIYATWTPED